MKSSRMQRRIATGAVDGGFRVVAHIHRGAGANQVFYNSTGGLLAGPDNEIAPAVARLETCWIMAEQLVDVARPLQGDGSGQTDLCATIEEDLSQGCFPAERGLVKRCEPGLVEGFYIGTEIQRCDEGLQLFLHHC